MSPDKVRVDLSAVGETLLWNLYQRAAEAARPRPVLPDPLAVDVVRRIDYPFAERFGSGRLGQWQALRAACFDREVRSYLARHPGGTVVALGEGLETQLWRVDDGLVRWITVDVPEVVALRERLLPGGDARHRTVAGSALDDAWVAAAQEQAGDGPVLVTAQGLLMYLRPEQVHHLVGRVAAAFPGGTLVLDGVPPWFSARTLRGEMRTAQGYQAPPMPWALDAAEVARLRAIPGVAAVTELRRPRGRGVLHGLVLPLLGRVPLLRRSGLTGLPVLRLDLATRASSCPHRPGRSSGSPGAGPAS